MKKLFALVMALLLAAGALTICAGAEEATAEKLTVGGEEYDIQYVLFLGTNDKDTNKPVFTEEQSREVLREILMKRFGGYTNQQAWGGWMDQDTEYQEYTLVIYLSDTTPEAVHAAADELVETFRQSSILIQSNPTKTEFYSPAN